MRAITVYERDHERAKTDVLLRVEQSPGRGLGNCAFLAALGVVAEKCSNAVVKVANRCCSVTVPRNASKRIDLICGLHAVGGMRCR